MQSISRIKSVFREYVCRRLMYMATPGEASLEGEGATPEVVELCVSDACMSP